MCLFLKIDIQREGEPSVCASFLELKVLLKVINRGERKNIYCIFKANKANKALLGSEAEIKESDLVSYIELHLKMQFAVRVLSGCFPDLLLSRGQR